MFFFDVIVPKPIHLVHAILTFVFTISVASNVFENHLVLSPSIGFSIALLSFDL